VIRKRGTSWQADVKVSDKRWRKSFPTEDSAIAAEKLVRSRLKRGLPAEEAGLSVSPPVTLEEVRQLAACRYWQGTPNERNAKSNSLDVVTILGSTRHPRSINSTDVDRLVDTLKARGNSAATINRKLAALSKILKYSFERDIIDRMPRIERKKESQGRLRWYTIEEEDRILAHLAMTGQHDFRDLVIFLLDSGCRASEASRLAWRDFDTDQGCVRFWFTKGDKHRSVPLPLRAKAVLVERASRRLPGGLPTDLVFPGWTDNIGRSLPMTKRWGSVMAELQINDSESVLHCLRHTYASRLVQSNVPLNMVQRLLGHSTPTMTMRYAHLAPSNLQAAIGAPDRVTPLRIQSADEVVGQFGSQVCPV
jgi:integrase